MKAFLTGLDPVQGTPLSPPAHARCALRLLLSLPPARGAALQHLRGLFDDQVCSHLLQRESGASSPSPKSCPGAEVLQEARRALAELVATNPRAWAPGVAAWASELMGQLSSKYSSRPGVPPPASLNELLQLWMSCPATRALLDIYSQCLGAMAGSCPDACVDALLDTSVQHSPHFDWVVAHVGSSFPGTIISRVLSCGLKDFCAHSSGGSEVTLPGTAGDKRVPKIASVVGILGHLASRHANSIKQELLRMFHESLGSPREHHKATVPFLLQLALMSPALLAAVSPELVDSLQPPVLNQLHQHFSGLPREELEGVVGVVVHLLCHTSAGALRTLRFLLATAAPATVIAGPGAGPGLHEGVREGCERLLQLLLLHLQKLVHGRSSPSLAESPPRPVPFLEALRPHVRELCLDTLRMERKRCLWQHQLLSLLSVHSAPHGAAEVLFFLLALARTPEELSLAPQLHAGLRAVLPDPLPAAVTAAVAQIHAGRLPQAQLAQLLHNLALLLQQPQPCGGDGDGGEGALGAALAKHLPELAQLLLHPGEEVAEAACRLLAACPLPRALPPAHLLPCVRAAVHRFFSGLWAGEAAALAPGVKLLVRLSSVSPAAAKAVLAQLVEGALGGHNAELFGGTAEPSGGQDTLTTLTTPTPPSVSLLDTNRRFTAGPNAAGGVWSVFHAGVIGGGPKPAPGRGQRGPEELSRNTQTFLSLVLRCCRGSGPAVGAEAAKAVAAALVESICPEAAGAELSWPPEELAKATVERDLRILRRFRQHPLLFPLLRLVAGARPALCYCSVLLRGLLASLVAHWDACRASSTVASPWHLRASCALVALLAEGSLLPPVLGNMHELFPELAPFEVHLLLLSVWGYLRENSPLPQKFTFQPELGTFRRDFGRDGDVGKHLAVLHSVLHRNIHSLGLLAGRFYP